MAETVALVTGFEPYGGRSMNPSAEVVKRLDGVEVGSTRVVGRVLPVSIGGLRSRARELMREIRPAVVVSLGLCPGEPTIRLERVAINLAHFEIPDNEGAVLHDDVVETGAPAAFMSTLPLREIERALLRAGIPARLSTSAGTFLCNATMYAFLLAAEEADGAACGLIHVPYLPDQVAGVLESLGRDQTLEPHQRSDLASMSLATVVEAVRIAVSVSLGSRA